jgi:outer membrane protein assembly factor BamB
MGDLRCLDANTGKLIWSKNFPKDYGAKTPIWGFCGHPLVYGNLLIALVGGEGSVAVAFDKATGKEVWKALSAPEPGYAPPTIIKAAGVDQLIIWHANDLVALNPKSGETYWSVPLKPNYAMAIMAARQDGDLLYAAGNGGAQAVVKLAADKPGAEVVWREDPVPMGRKMPKRGLAPINMTPFIDQGVIYGVDQPGMMRAVRLTTGERLWFTFEPVIGREEDEEYNRAATGTAFLVRNKDRYFIFAETGDLIIATLSPGGYEEISRTKLLEPTGAAFGRKVVWTHPAFANKSIYVRNDQEIVCYSLAK